MANIIHPTALIAPGVVLGDNNYIGPYCIIGFPGEYRKHWESQIEGRVIIGNNNILTGLVTVDSGVDEFTCIGNNVMLMKHSHLGHDCFVGHNSTISCGAKIGGHAHLFPDVNIGLNACIHQWVSIPEGVMIGMNAAVTLKTHLEPNRKYAGVPAKDIGSNIRAKDNS